MNNQQQQNAMNHMTSINPIITNQKPENFITTFPIPNPPPATAQTSTCSPPKTLWMGDIDPFATDESIGRIWSSMGKNVLIKLIKAKKGTPAASLNSGHAGYCFVEFPTFQEAKMALALNGTKIPNTNNNRVFRLNWASSATLSAPIQQSPEYSMFVGDLSPSTTEAHLLALFQQHFKSVKTVRVMTDPTTGASRCFGFVRFSNEHDRSLALVQMQGIWCAGRPLRVALATPRNATPASTVPHHHMNRQRNVPQNIQHLHQQSPPQYSTMQQQQYSIFPYNNDNFMTKNFNNYNPNSSFSGIDSHQNLMDHAVFGDAALSQSQPQFRTNLNMEANSSTSGINSAIPSGLQSQASPFVSSSNLPSTQNLNDISSFDNQYSFYGSDFQQQMHVQQHYANSFQDDMPFVLINGISDNVIEDDIFSLFKSKWLIKSIKLLKGKSCAIVEFANHDDARAAISNMQGSQINGSPIQLSWANTSAQTDASNDNSSSNQQQQAAAAAAAAAAAQQYVAAMSAAAAAVNNNPIMAVNLAAQQYAAAASYYGASSPPGTASATMSGGALPEAAGSNPAIMVPMSMLQQPQQVGPPVISPGIISGGMMMMDNRNKDSSRNGAENVFGSGFDEDRESSTQSFTYSDTNIKASGTGSNSN